MNVRPRSILLVLAGLAILVGGSIAWYLASPLFITSRVEEDFPIQLPDAEAMERMSEEELAALEAEAMAAAAKMPDKAMREDMPAIVEGQGPLVLVMGEFQDIDSLHRGSGTATIYQLPDGAHILRLEDFNVTNGPDLHVLLSAHPSPTTRAEVMEGYVDLGSLKGNVGNQNYDIPENTDITRFSSVVIYCNPFHVVFSFSTLR